MSSYDPAQARKALDAILSGPNVQAGLVSVRDRYGDYGFVGFYLLMVHTHRLEHYCFSCRILGMGIEQWLFERLRRPSLQVSGDVLTNLHADHAPITWINAPATEMRPTHASGLGRVLIRGGCEVQSLAHYLVFVSEEVVGEFPFTRDARPVLIDHSAFFAARQLGLDHEKRLAAAELGYTEDDFASRLFDANDIDVIVLSFWADGQTVVYQHDNTGLTLPFPLHHFNYGRDLLELSEDEIEVLSDAPKLAHWLRGLKLGYRYLGGSTYVKNGDQTLFSAAISRLFRQIPSSTPIFILLACEHFYSPDGEIGDVHHVMALNTLTRDAAVGYANIFLLDPWDFISGSEDMIDATHFDRLVYFRISKKIASDTESFRASIADSSRTSAYAAN